LIIYSVSSSSISVSIKIYIRIFILILLDTHSQTVLRFSLYSYAFIITQKTELDCT